MVMEVRTKDITYNVPVNTHSRDGSDVQYALSVERITDPEKELTKTDFGVTEGATMSYKNTLHLTQDKFKDVGEGTLNKISGCQNYF